MEKLHHKALLLSAAIVVANWYLLLLYLIFLLSPHFLSHASLPPPLCEMVQQGGFIPETVPTCQVIEHSSQLKSDAIQSGLSSPSAQASLNQPVHQVTASKHTF